MNKHDEKILNYTKRPCNTESIAFLCILVKFNVGNKNCISQLQALPFPPPGNPWVNLQNLANPGHLCKFFVKCPAPDFPKSLYFNKFYTFPPLSRYQ